MYPEGSSAEVIDLKRQLRLSNRTITELKEEIAQVKNQERVILKIPTGNLVLSRAKAHEYLCQNSPENGYATKYKQLMQSKLNISVEQLVDQFLDNTAKKFAFTIMIKYMH